MIATLDLGVTSTHPTLPIRTTRHDRFHSCRHSLFVLNLFGFTMAIREISGHSFLFRTLDHKYGDLEDGVFAC